jgi:hypothetical protein
MGFQELPHVHDWKHEYFTGICFLDKKILKKRNRNVQLIDDDCVECDNVVGKLGKLIPNHANVVGKLALNENRIRLRQGKKLNITLQIATSLKNKPITSGRYEIELRQ